MKKSIVTWSLAGLVAFACLACSDDEPEPDSSFAALSVDGGTETAELDDE